MVRKLTITVMVVVAWSVPAQDFPLLRSGKCMLFARGRNPRCYPSAAPLQPSSVGLIEFKTNGNVTYRWANCNHTDYASTAELMEDIDKQMRSNSKEIVSVTILSDKDTPLNILRTGTKDTLWSIDEVLINAPAHYYKIVRSNEGVEDEFIGPAGRTKLKNSPQYYTTRPVGFGVRKRISQDNNVYDIDYIDEKTGKTLFVKGIKDLPTSYEVESEDAEQIGDDDNAPFMNFCDNTDCYEWIPGEKTTVNEIPYWQIHFSPEVWYYPRNPATGEPLIAHELRMDYETATQKRKESVQNQTDQNLQRYRNPFFCDSASTVISFVLVGTDEELKNKKELVLSSIEAGSETVFEHYPPRAYIFGIGDFLMMQSCLLKVYGVNDAERMILGDMSTRCPGWQIKDKINGKVLFPLSKRIKGNFEKDETQRDDIFMYNKCPCVYESELNGLTPVQARKYLRMPIPSCSLFDMYKAGGYYILAKKYLKNPDDQKLIGTRLSRLSLIIEMKKKELQSLSMEIAADKKDKKCPSSWVDAMPDSWGKIAIK